MKEYKITPDKNGKRLDNYIKEKEKIPHFIFIKSLKKNKIKVNGKKESGNYKLKTGDIITSYIENINKNEKEKIHFSINYEDENIIIAEKEAGILCNDTTNKEEKTLHDEINEYLKEKNEPEAYPVHRIDLNTIGLVIFAKNMHARAILDRAIKERSIKKYYLCVTTGTMKKKSGKLEHQLFKDAKNNKVYIYEKPCKGSKTATMNYKCLKTENGLSLVECELITGRTHQIRSQLSYIGYPILGDDKYGNKTINKTYKERKQLLCAYKIKINFDGKGDILDYLEGKEIKAKKIPFIKKYFKNKA